MEMEKQYGDQTTNSEAVCNHKEGMVEPQEFFPDCILYEGVVRFRKLKDAKDPN